jgi:transcriptional regulator with XRE-family HTH domain
MGARIPQTKKDEIAARRRQVATLRLAHYTQAEIAERLDVSVGTVNSDLQAIRQEWTERRMTDYGDWLSEELAKLDRLELALLPLALQGQTAAADRVLSIMDRRSRLLGLDKPERHEHTVITMDTVEQEIARLEREMAARDSSDA